MPKAGKMVQWVKVSAAKSEDLSLSPRTHTKRSWSQRHTVVIPAAAAWQQ